MPIHRYTKAAVVLGLFAVLFASVDTRGDEELREIEERIEDNEREKKQLSQKVQAVEKRLELLRLARTIRQSVIEIEVRLEAAEDDGNDSEIDRLEQRLRLEELRLEEVFLSLRFVNQKTEIAELINQLREDDLGQLSREATILQTLHERRSQEILTRIAKVRAQSETDTEESFEELEERIEAFEEDFELRIDLIRLREELHWAREENQTEAIRELEAEIRILGGDDSLEQGESVEEGPGPIQLDAEEIAAAANASWSRSIIPLLKANCFECHDSQIASGDLDLELLIRQQPLVVNRSHWKNVMAQLQVRSMPPRDAEQPSEPNRRLLFAWLTNAIDNFDYDTVRQPGYEPARRLTHAEYNNTIRDLFGTDIRPADRFPKDLTATSGFENSANSLFLQPVLMERYIGAADEVVRQVFSEETDESIPQHVSDSVFAAKAPRNAIPRFASRAFRRPVEAEEVKVLLDQYEQFIAAGDKPYQAFGRIAEMVLISPSFLIRTEKAEGMPGESFPVSDWELASRLSYFLWASMPDDELFEFAAQGTLHDPETLRAQVDRMLDDRKARTLGSLFAAQWLGFQHLSRLKPDPIDNPWATDSLIEAMQNESALFFSTLVTQNEPIERLLDADFTFVNEELATHYRFDGITGREMRRVSLANNERSGILSHGSILAVTSFPGRTSPVKRGDWILSELLGTPPPPPPPNVSEFDDRIAERRRLTQRQKLEIHRSNPNCSACHSQIDPLGFALERFDWFGRYQPQRRGRQVDVAAKLPSGRSFAGLSGLQTALIEERRDDLVSQVTRKMLAYALGRQLEYYDEAAVREIIAVVEKDGRRFRSLIYAIVSSEPFLKKQIPKE